MSDVSAGRLHLEAVADTAGFARDAKRKIDAEVAAIKAKIKAELDTRGLVKQAREAAKIASEAAVAKIKVELDTRGLIGSARAAARLASDSATVRFATDINTSGLIGKARAAAALASAAAQVNIGLDFDGPRFEASLAAAIARMDGRYTINVNVDANTTGASAHMAAWRAAQSANSVDIPFNLNLGMGGGLGGLMGTFRKLKLPLIAGAAVLAASGLSAVAGALTAIVGSASQAAAGLAVLPGLLGSLVMAGGALIGAFSGVSDAVKEIADADKDGAQQAEQNADARVDAASAIADAQQALSNAYHDAEDAARQAMYGVSDAEWDLTEAQEANTDAQERLNDARADAKKWLDDLNESLKRMSLSEEQAANNLAKAKAALQDVMWDASATPQEVRDAQLNVDEAQQNIEDVKDQHAELAEEVSEANANGVAGSDIMTDAQEGASDAAHALMLAQRGLTEALHSQGDVARQNEQSIAAAQKALAAAQTTATDLTVQQNYALADQFEAYNKLSPAGQKFADFIYGTMRPRVRALRDALQGAVLPPVQRGITAAMPFFDTLQAGLVDTGGVVGGFVERLGGLFGSEGFNDNSVKIMDSNNRALTDFGYAVEALIGWLQEVTVAAGPTLLEPFAAWTRGLAESWQEMARTGNATGTMSKRFDKARQTIRLLADIIGNVSSALHGIFGAAAPAGDSILASTERVTQKWADWQNSLEGKSAVQDWVAKSREALSTFGRVIGAMGGFFKAIFNPELFGTAFAVLEDLIPTIKTVAGVLQAALSPVIQGLAGAFRELGPQVETLFVALGPLLKGVGDVLGEMIRQAATTVGFVLKIITPIVGWLSGLIGPLLSKLKVPIAYLLLSSSSVVGFFVRLGGVVGKLFNIARIAMNVLGKVLGPVLGIFGKLVVAVGGWLKGMTGLSGVIGVVVRGLGSVLKVAGRLLGALRNFGRVVGGFFLGLFDPLFDAARELWDEWFGHSIFPDIIAAFGVFADAVQAVFGVVISVFRAVTDVALFLWKNAVQPGFAAMRTIIGVWWSAVKIYFAAMKFAIGLIVTAVTFLWKSVVVPGFAVMRRVIAIWWAGVKVYFAAFRAVMRAVISVVQFLYRNVVVPAFRVMRRVIGLWWAGVKIYFRAMVAIVRSIISVVRFLWRNVVQPGFRAMGRIIGVWWSGVKVYFNAFKRIIGVLGDVLDFLWHRVVSPVFNGIKRVIENVWKNGVKPVLDKMVKFVKETIPDAFDEMKEGIKSAWDALKEIAAVPIRWVVDHVYNDGIRKVVNMIPGVPDLDPVTLNFKTGGTFGFARGGSAGTLPGYSPGKDDYSFASTDGKGINLNLGGGESIMRPEWTKNVGRKGVAMMNAAAAKGKGALDRLMGGGDGTGRGNRPGSFSDGGVLNKTLSFFLGGTMPLQAGTLTNNHGLPYYGATFAGDLNGPLDLAKPPAKIYAWKPGTVAHMNYGNDSHGRYGNHAIINHPSGGSSLYAHMSSMLSGLLGKVVSAGQMIGRVGDTGNAQGAHLHFETRGAVPIDGGVGGSGGNAPVNPDTGQAYTAAEQAARDKGSDEGGNWASRIKKILKALTSLPGTIKSVKDKFGVWGGYMKDMATEGGRGVQQWINDKIPDEIDIPGPNIPLPDNPINIFDRGGEWLSGQMGANLSGKSELVFTNDNIVDLTTNLATIARGLRAATVTNDNSRSGNSGLTIEKIELSAPPEKVPEVLDELRHTLRILALGGVHARGTLGAPV